MAAVRNKLILVIDDEAVTLSLVREVLEKSAFTTLTADSGLDGLKQLNSSAPDLIILDINMPDLDGIQTCRMIRAQEKHKTTPILMMTARGEITDMMEARKVGANDYLVKPIDPTILLRKIERLFAR